MLLTLCFLSQQPRCVLEIVLHGTTHGGAHLLACKLHANRSAEKTRALPEASFLEAVKLEACRLDRSEGSLYDVLRPVYLRTKVRINRPIRLFVYAPPRVSALSMVDSQRNCLVALSLELVVST